MSIIGNKKEFWNNRALKYGHTGWNNPIIYAYDQSARLKAIEKIITSLNCKKELALDFGSGTGDFAKLLAKRFKSVIAFDISKVVLNIAQDKYGQYSNIKFLHANSITNVMLDDGSLNLILSVTVLDHILDDEELSRTLLYFHQKLYNNGYVVALEYAPSTKRNSTEYQRFSTFDEWVLLFYKYGFSLESYYGFYHPKESSCKSYFLYINNWKVKLLRRFISAKCITRNLRKFLPIKSLLGKLAYQFGKGKTDFFWEGKEEDFLKIMIFKKSLRSK